MADLSRRLINRIQGRVFGWFDSKDAREVTPAAPAKFSPKAKLALDHLEDRVTPATFTVTNATDSLAATANDGTLRGAILAANADAAPDNIDFGPLFSTAQTITVLGRIAITNPVTITGTQASGVNNVTISGGNAFGIFSTTSTGTPGQAFLFDKLNLTNGAGGLGGSAGAINILGPEFVTVDNSKVTNNSATLGGAFRLSFVGTSLAAPGGTLTLSNSIISGNTALNNGTTEGVGGIVRITNFANFNITNCVVSNNSASQGAIFITIGSTSVTIDKSTLINNTAATAASTFGARGGIGYLANSTLTPLAVTISNSVISGNSAGIGGAILQTNNVQNVTIENCSVTNNSASGSRGGFLYAFNGGANNTFHNSFFQGNAGNQGSVFNIRGGTWNLNNSTVTGNSATADGGAIRIYDGATTPVVLNVNNSTITSNTSSSTSTTQGDGAGAINSSTANATINITSSIISGNTMAAGGVFNDLSILDTATLNITNSAIGTATGFTADTSTNNLAPGPFSGLKVNTLQDNGGALQGSTAFGNLQSNAKSFGILSGSPLINAGSNPNSEANDTRGAGFPRVVGIAADIGSFEFAPSTVPTFNKQNYTTVTTDNKNDAGINPYVFVVTYVAPTGETLVPGSAGTDDVSVTVGVNTFTPISAVYNSTDGNLTAQVTYTINPNPAGTSGWDFGDSGVYSVKVNAGTSLQGSGGFFANAGTVGTFNVAVGTTFTVDTFSLDEATDTDGKTSLREAIIAANAPGAGGPAKDFIVFDPTIFAADQTITLLTALGTLPASTDMTITGPTASRVTVSGVNGGFRILTVSDDVALTSTASNSVTVNNLTLTAASGTGAGGAVVGNSDKLFFNNSTISNNIGSNQNGAGVFVNANATLSLTESTISGNSAAGTGGAISTGGNTTISVTGSTLFGNTAANYLGGGALHINGSPAQLRFLNSTISGNNAFQGGAISLFNFANAANIAGSKPLEIINSTVTNNTANLGGGISRINGQGGVTLTSSIVSGNAAGTNPDIAITGGAAANSITATFSAVGVDPGEAWSTSSKLPASGNLAFGASLVLTPLQNNGGPTLTHGLAQGSAALDAGNNSLSLATDQRGATFPRTVGAATDIGAVEGLLAAPGAQAALLNIVPGAPSDAKSVYTFTVTYTASGSATINASTIDNNDVVVTGPGGYSKTATLTGTTGSGATITATYTVPANTLGGANWDIGDDGVYTAKLNAGAVLDSNTLPAAAGTLGNFQVFYANSFVVTTQNDTGVGVLDDGDGQLSFREAVTRANLLTATGGFGPFPAADTITFFKGTPVNGEFDFTNPATIGLSSGQVTVSDSLNIVGPNTDPNLLTFAGDGINRLFFVNLGVNTFTMSNATVTGGANTGNGGAFEMRARDATFNNMVFSNNNATGIGSVLNTTIGNNITFNNSKFTGNNSKLANGFGGTISATSSVDSVKITLNGSDFSNNTATGFGSAVAVAALGTINVTNTSFNSNLSGAGGGAIFVGSNVTLNLTDSTLTTNSATTHGGAIYARVGTPTVNVTNSTLSGNQSTGNGGAIYFAAGGSLNVVNSTISGNTAVGANGGGAIYFYGAVSSNGFNITNSTIANNIAGSGGGGAIEVFVGSGTFNIRNSTISGNSAALVGGAFYGYLGAVTVNIVSSVLSGNSAAGAAGDFYLNALDGTATATFSAIGKDESVATGLNYSSPTNIAFGTPLLLGTLANNGGTTETFLPGAGSPLLDKGSNPLALTTDQRGGTNVRVSGASADIGSVEVQVAGPVATGFIVNNGSTARSRINTIEVTFGSPVLAANFQGLGDIKLTRTAVSNPATGVVGDIVQSGPAALNHITVTQGGANSLILTFDNNGSFTTETVGVENGSLSDGYWQLQVGAFTSTLNDLALRRLFGDSTNSVNGTVDGSDFLDFGNFFNSNDFRYDYNNDGTISGADLLTFGNRFGRAL